MLSCLKLKALHYYRKFNKTLVSLWAKKHLPALFIASSGVTRLDFEKADAFNYRFKCFLCLFSFWAQFSCK